jgi:hypothetical protein
MGNHTLTADMRYGVGYTRKVSGVIIDDGNHDTSIFFASSHTISISSAERDFMFFPVFEIIFSICLKRLSNFFIAPDKAVSGCIFENRVKFTRTKRSSPNSRIRLS